MTVKPEIKVVPDPAAVAHEAAEIFLETSEAAIELRGRFAVVLAGGLTPKPLYQLLASPQVQAQIDWPNIDIFFGDERCVPPDHADSNYRMAREALLGKVPIPGDNIYRIRAEASDPNEAAKEYGQILKDKFDDEGGADLVLLGMGEDGHTASLFPNSPALKESKHRCVATVSPRGGARITLTAPFFNRADRALVMVYGPEKLQRVAEVLEGPADPQRLPIQLIAPQSGRLMWLLDVAAAGMHEP